MAHGSNKAVIAALLANAGIAIAKMVGFFITGASSMLAEAVHSFADSGNQALLLLGGRLSKRRASREHPFGYGRERYFWAFVVALVIFALGSVFAIYEGIHKFTNPEPLSSPLVAIAILTVGLGLEGWSFRTAIKEATPLRGKASWLSFVRHTKQAELPVVLLEDLGALIGLAVAMIGVGLAMLTGDARFDALGSIVIGLLLGIIAVVLAMEMRSLLIGESARPADEDAIEAALTSDPAVERVIHFKTMHLGPDEILLAAKIAIAPTATMSELGVTINAAEARVRAAVPKVRVIYIEPDVDTLEAREASSTPEASSPADGSVPTLATPSGSTDAG